MFAVLHSDINSHKSGLLPLTSQPYCKESSIAKVKDGIINLFLRNYLIERCNFCYHQLSWIVLALKVFYVSQMLEIGLHCNIPHFYIRY
jgi:hypothetical protein